MEKSFEDYYLIDGRKECLNCEIYKKHDSDETSLLDLTAFNKDFVKASKFCWSCHFWNEQFILDEQREKSKKSKPIIVEHQHYVADLEKYDGTIQCFKGFGGAKFYVKFNDDDKIYCFDNVWHQGDIPQEFWEKMPNNAVFVTKEDFEKQQQLNK